MVSPFPAAATRFAASGTTRFLMVATHGTMGGWLDPAVSFYTFAEIGEDMSMAAPRAAIAHRQADFLVTNSLSVG